MKNAIFAVAVIAAAGTVASASEVITSWVNFGQPGSQVSSPVGTEAAGVTGTEITRGAGLNASGAGNSISASGWSTDASQDYFSFGFTVDAGSAVDLETLWLGSRSSNTGPGELGLFYSVDGFTTALHTFTQTGTDFNNQIIDLSSVTDLTGTVEFRIAAISNVSANGGSLAGTGTFRLGDHFDGSNFSEMRFVGEVNAVPAPGAIALAGLGGLVATRRRRG